MRPGRCAGQSGPLQQLASGLTARLVLGDAAVLAHLNTGPLPEPALHDLPDAADSLVVQALEHASNWTCLPALWQVSLCSATEACLTSCWACRRLQSLPLVMH